MGLAYQYKDTNPVLPTASWGVDQSTLIVHGQSWSLPQIRKTAGELVDEVDDGLEQLLSGATPEELGLNLSPDMIIHDQHTNHTPGYSLLTDHDNGFDKLKHHLGAHLMSTPEGKQFYRGLQHGNISWKREGILKYLDVRQTVTRKMALTWQMIGGPGSRGSEFETLSLTEDIDYGRSIIWFNGRLVFTIPYNKSSALTCSHKAVAPAVP
ncbi:ATP-dependent DNA helicase tlh2 [Ceratobasidium sp. AG-Ba]|nr:ATP-dependent DNA helicase tlh2 [Ceratobasidium sp. AG-Ba]